MRTLQKMSLFVHGGRLDGHAGDGLGKESPQQQDSHEMAPVQSSFHRPHFVYDLTVISCSINRLPRAVAPSYTGSRW